MRFVHVLADIGDRWTGARCGLELVALRRKQNADKLPPTGNHWTGVRCVLGCVFARRQQDPSEHPPMVDILRRECDLGSGSCY